MVSKDHENANMIEELEKREAGVTDLFEFYAGIEAVYAASLTALEEGHITLVSNSANY